MNNSGIKPLNYRVLVKPIAVEKVTSGGIILPDIAIETQEERIFKGVLVDMGANAFDRISVSPEVGDVVYFTQFEGTEHVGKDGETYRILNDDQVNAIITKDGEIKPIWYNILVEIESAPEKSSGGVYYQDTHKDKENMKTTQGIIIAKSADAFVDYEDKADVGDKIMFIRYSGFWLKDQDKPYRIMKDQEVCGIFSVN